MIWLQALVVTSFVLVHLFAGKLRFLEGFPRSRWLSLAGGISVAYVFLHIFPELEAAQRAIGEDREVLPFLEHHAYLGALVGLSVFYGLQRVVTSRQEDRGQAPGTGGGETTTGFGIFWVHVASFAIYNGLIGYLLVHREEGDVLDLLLFGFALSVHFLVNDYGLRHDHRDTYRRIGRWILAGAVVAGWAAGLTTTVSEAALGMLFAFLAGGIILNVLKEELPRERQSRFAAFAAGATFYALLLLLI